MTVPAGAPKGPPPVRRAAWRGRIADGLLAVGLGAAAVALLDPLRPAGVWLGPLAAGLGWGLGVGARAAHRAVWARCGAVLALAFAAGAWVVPEFGADAPEFFVYLPSLAFDHDLSLRDDWLEMGYDETPPATSLGLTRNRHAIGPALVWSPFYALAHVYVRADAAWGARRHVPDGHAPPYRRAAALGTITVALAGAFLLARALTPRFGAGVAWLAVGGTLLASPLLYYVFAAPLMSHGATFGAAAMVLWAAERVRRGPTPALWIGLGALCGLLVVVRWQALVYGLLVAPLMLHGLRRGSLRPWVALAAGAAALAVFTPQMLVWHTLFGRALTMPQGSGFIDWRSPHWLDTLISADHGLFTWSPLMLPGLLGLVAGVRRDPWPHVPALAIIAATVWINGGAADWAGSDAFGARRFDLTLPLLALGLAAVIAALRRQVARRPLLAPAVLVAVAVLWNLGFVTLFREQRYEGPLRVERLAADQARLAHRSLGDVFETLAGERGRALVYKLFAADYLYTVARPRGRIVLSHAADAELSGHWSPARRTADGPAFRWAYPPEACWLVPIDEPYELRARLTLSPARLARDVGVRVNATAIGGFHLDGGWQQVELLLPRRALRPGPNWLCLLSPPLPDAGDDEPFAAVAAFEGS